MEMDMDMIPRPLAGRTSYVPYVRIGTWFVLTSLRTLQ